MTQASKAFSRPTRGRLRRGLILLAAALLAALIYVWPARRNYYGKLDEVDVRLDVPYLAESRDPKQQLDLYLPRRQPRPYPIVVFVHGGYWKPLDRRWLEPLLGTHGNVGGAFAGRGVGAAIVGYRQYPQVQSGDDSLDDIARAIRFVREGAPSWGGDRDRIYLMGHSAGGQLVSLMGLDPRILSRNGLAPDAVAGFISVDGIFDLRASLGYLKADQAQILAGIFGTTDDALAAHSPVTFARADHRPMLFVDSTGDQPVCLDGFRKMRARLSEVGSRAKFVELPDLGHNEAVIRMGMQSDPITPLVMELIGPPASL